MSLTSAGNLTVSNNLIVNEQTTLGGSLISSSSIQAEELVSTGSITGETLSLTGSLSCPNSSLTCSNVSSSGTISGQTVTSLGNINGYGALNLTGTSGSTSQIVQSGTTGTNVLGSSTIQGNLIVNGNITANSNQGAYTISDGDNINMTGAVVTQSYTNSSNSSNYSLNNTLLASQFLGSITQTQNNGSSNNSNSLQQTTFNGTVTMLYNLIVNSTSISPTVLSYLSGLSSNLQTQLTNIVNTFASYANLSSANTFTNTNTFNNQLCISANSQSIPSQTFGLVVSNNYLTGLEGTDLINTGYNSSNGLSVPAFNFYQKINSSTMNTLMTLLANGNLNINGNLLISGTNISSTYLTQANASSTYLTQSNASSTYLTQSNASSTYLTQANAISNYANLSSSNTFSNFNQFNNRINVANNCNQTIPSETYGLSVMQNYILGQNETDFVNTCTQSSSSPSFVFYEKFNSTTMNQLLMIRNTGDCEISGNAKVSGNVLVNGTDIANIYLTQSNASSTYLTQSNASSTYITQSYGSLTYAPINNTTLTGTTNIANLKVNSIPFYYGFCGVYMIDNNQNYRALITSLSNSYISTTSVSYPYLAGSSTTILGFSFSDDAGYLILPNFGLRVWDNTDYTGDVTLYVINNTSVPRFYAPTSSTGQSWQVFYETTQI